MRRGMRVGKSENPGGNEHTVWHCHQRFRTIARPFDAAAAIDDHADIGVRLVFCCWNSAFLTALQFEVDLLPQLIGVARGDEQVPRRQPAVGAHFVAAADMLPVWARMQAVVQERVIHFGRSRPTGPGQQG